MSLAPLSVGRIMATDTNNTSGTNGTNGSGSTGTTGSTVKTAGSSELGREAFLQLLVAQLKYQDPTKPMDASQMIAQSAQLTMVDKLSEISTALAAQAVTGRLSLAGSVIGKEITFTGTDGYKVQAVVNSVKFANGELVLSTPDWDVPMSSVEAIGSVPASAPAAAPAAAAVPAAAAATTPAATTPAATTPAATTTPAAATTPAATTDTTDPATTDPAVTDPDAVPAP